MSEMVESTPPLISEDDKKFEDADIAEKMKNVKIQEIPESSPPLHETDGAENDNMVRENGEEGFHTPEVTSENQNDSNFVNDDAKLDYDEIEDNPAYIPRKGKYYMHDSRDADEVEEKKTSRADGAWKHDRYNERFQRPKTKKQIMTRYGFDIREENTQDVGLSQKKRTQEVNKEEYGEEITKGKRPTKKDTRRKQPSREKAYDVTPKLRHQNSHKLVGQRSERKVSESRNKEDRNTNDGRANEDDDDLHVGQRRRVRSELRRDRHDRVDVRVVRNVRGSRGGLTGYRTDRYQQQTKERFDRDRCRGQNGSRASYQKEQHEEQRNYENHRRGAMRGTVRGVGNSYGLSRGQQTRTISTSTRQHDTRDHIYHREDAPPQRNTGFSPRGIALDGGNYYDTRGGYALRGNYSARSRGGISHSNRAGYGDVYPSRGFTGPKRYSEQRGEIMPLPAQMTVPPPIPPQHNFNIPRQPTDVVYFDPTQQPSRQPLPPREKKIIEIVPPSN